MGLVAEIKTQNRGPRSNRGALKQSLKGHRHYKKHVNPMTNQPFTSLLERFDHDVIYRFRMLSNGWSRESIPALQRFLEEPLVPQEHATRSRAAIERATHTYLANPELDGSNAWAEADHVSNPDWKRVKAVRDEFQQGRAQHRQLAPVVPWVAQTLERDFGYVDVVSEVEPASGEAQASASGSGSGKGAAAAAAAGALPSAAAAPTALPAASSSWSSAAAAEEEWSGWHGRGSTSWRTADWWQSQWQSTSWQKRDWSQWKSSHEPR